MGKGKRLSILGAVLGLFTQVCYAVDKFDVLPDLPEPLANAAQASSVTTTEAVNTLGAQASIGQEPNFISMIFSLVFVILLIYATGILYTKLNKFGVKALKRQIGDNSDSQVAVLSTTALGANKTLHVIELNGKRMLVGASNNSIHLIKDLGSYPPCEIEEGEFSKIEIPNIRIPKIEIPKIEIPGFTRVVSKAKKEEFSTQDDTQVKHEKNEIDDEKFEISDIYEEENPDGIIDKLFQTTAQESLDTEEQGEIQHKVDPDEFALYKKYL